MAFPRLARWQVAALVGPIVTIAVFLLSAAAIQIHVWGLNWLWAIVGLVGVGWQWLAARWLRDRTDAMRQAERAIAELSEPLPVADTQNQRAIAAQSALDKTLETAAADGPLWEDWELFWTRCQELVRETALIYHPEVKYPLLNIYVPQAYGLIRGTVDDLDRWMEQLSPVLGRVTIAQAVDAYELYQKWEPSARQVVKAWNWAQWVLNPAVAVTRFASQGTSDRANQELVSNLGQLLREAALRNLSARAIDLYGNADLGAVSATAAVAQDSPKKAAIAPPQTTTLRQILGDANSQETVEAQPVNIVLVGRTGAGKSSLVNTLFSQEQAKTDVLPSTDQFTAYQWTLATGEQLQLWDSPGYEQVDGMVGDRLAEVARAADLVLLVTPALDPALVMDCNFVKALRETENAAPLPVPVITVVTQVDRVRPAREWQPPYDWRQGDRPKENNIREAVGYRQEVLGEQVTEILPLVTWDGDRPPWGSDALATVLLEQVEPAKQERLARFLQSLDARSLAAARLIDKYIFQMSTTQGLASFLKSP
ncbi:MAG: GTPase, partial [Cyanobacteria bacterium P01_H01_bin.130]